MILTSIDRLLMELYLPRIGLLKRTADRVASFPHQSATTIFLHEADHTLCVPRSVRSVLDLIF